MLFFNWPSCSRNVFHVITAALKLFPICCTENETEIHSTPHAALNQLFNFLSLDTLSSFINLFIIVRRLIVGEICFGNGYYIYIYIIFLHKVLCYQVSIWYNSQPRKQLICSVHCCASLYCCSWYHLHCYCLLLGPSFQMLNTRWSCNYILHVGISDTKIMTLFLSLAFLHHPCCDYEVIKKNKTIFYQQLLTWKPLKFPLN